MNLIIHRHFYRENIIALFILTIFIIVVFNQSFIKPSMLLPAGGDGMKSYFTYLYHVKYDSSYWVFEGMNYPFGENIVFTDNQPILANVVKFVHNIHTLSNESIIAIHNLVLLLSLVFGAFGIFLCLRKLDTGFYFALACAAGLILLQPQINRFNSHYSLVYPVLPWVFYMWVKIWNKESKILSSIVIGILATFFGLLHMYHFLTIAVLCVLAGFLSLIQNLSLKNVREQALLIFIQVAIPFATLFLVSNAILPVPDRPQKVWGFFSYHSSWEGLFFSYELPLFRFINENIIHVRNIDPIEAINYIGLIAVLFIISTFVYVLIKWRKSFSFFKGNQTNHSRLAWIFVLSAIISFGLPFTIKGMGWLLDYTGPFQQFRSIGRIGWISFYAINFLALPFIYKRVAQFSKPILKYTILLLVPLVIFLEGYYSLPEMFSPPDLQEKYRTPELPILVNTSLYQAILPDPYLHAGSECFSWGPTGGNQDQFFEIGLQLGLPGLAVVMSRHSLYQATLLNQLVCLPYDVPEIITYLKKKDSRPLLVLESKLDLFSRKSGLTHWTNGSKIVYETETYKLRELQLQNFDSIVKQFQDSIQKIQVDTLFSKKITLEHTLKEGEWGYEGLLFCDSVMWGETVLSFEIEFFENTDVNAITGVWQITKDHHNVDHFTVRNNYHIKRIQGNRLFIEIPIVVKPETHKIAFRLWNSGQRKTDELKISDIKIFKTTSVQKDK